jgi:hypothetical protein
MNSSDYRNCILKKIIVNLLFRVTDGSHRLLYFIHSIYNCLVLINILVPVLLTLTCSNIYCQ